MDPRTDHDAELLALFEADTTLTGAQRWSSLLLPWSAGVVRVRDQDDLARRDRPALILRQP